MGGLPRALLIAIPPLQTWTLQDTEITLRSWGATQGLKGGLREVNGPGSRWNRGEQKGHISIKELDRTHGESHGSWEKHPAVRQSLSFLYCQKRGGNCSSRVHSSGTPTPLPVLKGGWASSRHIPQDLRCLQNLDSTISPTFSCCSVFRAPQHMLKEAAHLWRWHQENGGDRVSETGFPYARGTGYSGLDLRALRSW